MQDESLFLIQYDHLVPHAISDDWLMEPNQSMLRQLILSYPLFHRTIHGVF